jgi:hypothetical protein
MTAARFYPQLLHSGEPPAAPAAETALSHQSAPESYPTVAAAQREAVRRYPELGVAGSKLNREFLARHTRYERERPDYFRDASWPMRLAEEAAQSVQPSR